MKKEHQFAALAIAIAAVGTGMLGYAPIQADSPSGGDYTDSDGDYTDPHAEATDTPAGDYADPHTEATTTSDGDYTDPHAEAVNTVDYEEEISIENGYNETQTVELEIVRKSENRTVHSGEYSVEPGEWLTPAYKISAYDMDEIETFRIRATVGNQTEAIDLKMNECVGNAIIQITEGGRLYVTHSIC